MPNQLTVTAKTGPAVQDTSLVLSAITSITFNLVLLALYVEGVTVAGVPFRKEFDLTGVTTVTDSVSSNVHTFVVS